MCEEKETNFLAYDASDAEHVSSPLASFPVRTLHEYTAQFDNVLGESVIGEASPDYFYSSLARSRIKEHFGNVRLLLILRNPADRLYSMYQAQVRDRRTEGKWQDFATDTSWLEKHRYLPYVSAYKADFSTEQLKVMLYEDLEHDVERFCADVYSWLGVSSEFKAATEAKHNLGGIPKNKTLHRLSQNQAFVRAARNLVPKAYWHHIQSLRRRNMQTAPALSHETRNQILSYYDADFDSLEALTGLDVRSAWKNN